MVKVSWINPLSPPEVMVKVSWIQTLSPPQSYDESKLDPPTRSSRLRWNKAGPTPTIHLDAMSKAS